MRERQSRATGRGVRETEALVVEGGCCEKDLRLVGSELYRKGDELRMKLSENLSWGMWLNGEKQIGR